MEASEKFLSRSLIGKIHIKHQERIRRRIEVRDKYHDPGLEQSKLLPSEDGLFYLRAELVYRECFPNPSSLGTFEDWLFTSRPWVIALVILSHLPHALHGCDQVWTLGSGLGYSTHEEIRLEPCSQPN